MADEKGYKWLQPMAPNQQDEHNYVSEVKDYFKWLDSLPSRALELYYDVAAVINKVCGGEESVQVKKWLATKGPKEVSEMHQFTTAEEIRDYIKKSNKPIVSVTK